VVCGFLKSVQQVAAENSAAAFTNQKEAVEELRGGVQKSKGALNWALPLLETMVKDMRRIAYIADATAQGTEQDEFTETAFTEVSKNFQMCINDKMEGQPMPNGYGRFSWHDTKKVSTLMFLNELYNISSKVNRFWKSLDASTKKVEHQGELGNFRTAHMVEYKYNVGKKALFDAQFKKADQYLTDAFNACHRGSRANKRLMLTYLVPVRLLRGQMPSEKLLQKYDMGHYLGITQALLEGNLKDLQAEIDRYEAFFVQWGLYPILMRLRPIAYRNLFKKVAAALKLSPKVEGKAHIIDLAAFKTVLTFSAQDTDIDSDEVECIVANLIAKKYIKGYISHSQQKLVTAKNGAFPSLAGIEM